MKTKDRKTETAGKTPAPDGANKVDDAAEPAGKASKPASEAAKDRPKEIGGRGGADPTRFGDWEIDGRCVDF